MTDTVTEQQPLPEQAPFAAAMQDMATAVLHRLQAEKQVNLTEFAIQLNVVSLQIATLVEMLIAAGQIDRAAWLKAMTDRVTTFTADLNRPRIQLAAPRGRQ